MSRVLSILALLAAPATAALAGPGAPPPAPAPAVPAPSLVIQTDEASVEVRLPDVVARALTPAAAAASARVAPAPVPTPAPGPADLFVPDVYPSEVDAARAMGELWARRAAGRWDGEPELVRVYCCDPRLYAAVAEGVRSRLGDAKVEKARAEQCPDGFHEDAPGGDEAWLLVDVKVKSVQAGPTGKFAGGDVVVSSRGASDAAVSARYVEKPWLAEPGGFSSAGRRFVVGRSDPMRPAMSEAEAARAARLAAVDEVVAMVRSRVPRAAADEGWLRRRVEEKLAAGQFEVDRFPQRFDRRVGSTWRGAVLLDLSDPNLNHLAGDLSRQYRAERQDWLTSTASALAVLLVTYALYRLANAFTRGYFVWSLRTAAAVVATAAVVLLLMVIG